MSESIAFLIMLALPLMGSPGPVNLSLAAMGSAFGLPASLRYFAGCVLGSVVVLLAVPAGQRALLADFPDLAPVARALAATYVLYLAWRIATAPLPERCAAVVRAPFSGGFLLASGNPKAYLAVGAICSVAMAEADDGPVELALTLAVLVAVSLTVKASWLFAGTTIGGLASTPRQARIANLAFAGLMVASVALAVVAA